MEQTWPLLLTVQGALTVAGHEAGQHLPKSETCFKGSQTKGARVFLLTLLQCVPAKRKGQEAVTQDKKPLPKGDKEGIAIHFQSNAHSFWPGALWPAFLYGGLRGALSSMTPHPPQ